MEYLLFLFLDCVFLLLAVLIRYTAAYYMSPGRKRLAKRERKIIRVPKRLTNTYIWRDLKHFASSSWFLALSACLFVLGIGIPDQIWNLGKGDFRIPLPAFAGALFYIAYFSSNGVNIIRSMCFPAVLVSAGVSGFSCFLILYQLFAEKQIFGFSVTVCAVLSLLAFSFSCHLVTDELMFLRRSTVRRNSGKKAKWVKCFLELIVALGTAIQIGYSFYQWVWKFF